MGWACGECQGPRAHVPAKSCPPSKSKFLELLRTTDAQHLAIRNTLALSSIPPLRW